MTAEAAPGIAAQVDWLRANEAVVGHGLDWIGVRLDGGSADEAQRRYHAARTILRNAGSPAAIDRVADAFGLSSFEEDALLIALAPAIDGGIAARYGAALGRLGPSPATPHLLAMLLFGSTRLAPEGWALLAQSGSLVAQGLLSIGDAELAAEAALSLPQRVRDLLLGFDVAAPDMPVRPLPIVALPPRLDALATRTANEANPARLQLIGPPRSGKRGLAAALLARHDLSALLVECDAPLGGRFPAIAREAILAVAGLVIAADAPGDVARDVARDWQGPLIVLRETPDDGLALPIVRLGPLPADERAALWHRVQPGLSPAAAGRLAEQFGLGPSELAATTSDDVDRLWAACRAGGGRNLDALATRMVPRRTLDDLVLDADTRAALTAVVAQVEHRHTVLSDWGYRSLLGAATGVTALFAGPSGVGKTMAGEAIAHALSLDLYVVDLARVVSKYIGETEKNLSQVFDAAEASGAVLFFDEADALFGKRTELRDSHDRYANAEISYLLQRMDRYAGLAILATNLKSHLDTAFLRRLRLVVDFAAPDAGLRKILWQRALPDGAPCDDIDFDRLARIELTGGNITTVAVAAAFRAAAARESIGMTHLAAALAAEFRKLDREPGVL